MCRVAPPPSRALRVVSEGQEPAALDLGASATLGQVSGTGRWPAPDTGAHRQPLCDSRVEVAVEAYLTAYEESWPRHSRLWPYRHQFSKYR